MNGVKCGFGTYLWPNGSTYNGEWRDNVINGYVRDIESINIICRVFNNG